jgi:hypothetical protein
LLSFTRGICAARLFCRAAFLRIQLGALIVLVFAPSLARAQALGRTRWEYDGGSFRRTLSWIEETGKGKHAFVETARNPVFVELLDPSRDYTVRLYADKLLLRGGKGPARKFAKFSRIYGGSWSDSQARLKWEYASGFFRAQKATAKPAAWVERNFDGLHLFFEANRSADFVELKDRSRDYTVRLSNDQLKISGGNKTAPERFVEFTRISAGHWARPPRMAPPEVVVDIRDAPEVAAWAERAKRLCEEWYAIIFDLLNPVGRPPSRSISIVFKGPSMKGIAYTKAPEREITVSADWVKKHPDDVGMVIHELTHVVQNYPRSKSSNPFWVVEGIADYVRYYEFEPEKRTPIDWKKTYRDGYGIASAFLDWIQRTRDPHIIEKLNARLAIGEYTDELFADYAGAPLEQLWAEFLTAERPKRRQ